mgnify:CR=1 FL=1
MTKTKKRKLIMKISEKKYKQLLTKKRSKKKMTKKEKKMLNDSMYIKYCKCLKHFEYKKDKRGYPICMSSIYTKRKVKPPKNASTRCKKVFNK